MLQMSIRLSYVPVFPLDFKISGAMYSGVPQIVFITDSGSINFEYPKSDSFISVSGSLVDNRTFSNLTSLKKKKTKIKHEYVYTL